MSYRYKPKAKKRPGKCFKCGTLGHWASTCFKRTNNRSYSRRY